MRTVVRRLSARKMLQDLGVALDAPMYPYWSVS
jgi:hypothetical protein